MGLAAGCAALVDDKHDHAGQAAKPEMAMGGMHEHMKTMQAQMAQIRAATDPKEKDRLVNEHMKTMEESMSGMRGMMGCGKM
jgi:hypothetical protein